MKQGHHPAPLPLPPLPPDAGNAVAAAGDPPQGGGPQQQQNRGIDQPDLLQEVGATGRHFLVGGHPVARRPAFHHVADVGVGLAKSHRGQNFIEELAGFAHKRQAGFVFGLPRPFADRHHPGLPVSPLDHHVGAGGREGAFLTGAGAGREGIQIGKGVGIGRPKQAHLLNFRHLSRQLLHQG